MQKILIYHSIATPDLEEVGASLYTVSEANFRQQMRCVSELAPRLAPFARDVASCRVSALKYSNARTRERENARTILITFDDGLVDNYLLAFPILKEFGLKAYFFVIAGKIGQPGYMSWQQLREMKGAGMIIGSHGLGHKFLPELNNMQLNYDLSESKRILEENLGCEAEYLSIPRGFVDKRVINTAKEIGYKAIFASYQRNLDGFVFGRISVKYNWDLGHFVYVLNNGLSPKEKLQEFVKTVAKKILGARAYDKLRAAILRRNI